MWIGGATCCGFSVKNGIPGLSFAEVLWPHSQHRRRGDGDGAATWCNDGRIFWNTRRMHCVEMSWYIYIYPYIYIHIYIYPCIYIYTYTITCFPRLYGLGVEGLGFWVQGWFRVGFRMTCALTHKSMQVPYLVFVVFWECRGQIEVFDHKNTRNNNENHIIGCWVPQTLG